MELTQQQIDSNSFPVRKKHIKMEILDFDYKIVDTIEADCIGGTLQKDGNSILRRSGNVQIAVSTIGAVNYILSKLDSYKVQIGSRIWLDRYIKIYIGIEDYRRATGEIIWNNFGICLIDAPVVSQTTSQYEISFNVLDIMAKITGDRQGQLTGMGTVIPQGEYDYSTTPPQYVATQTREVLYSILTELGGFTRVSISEIPDKYKYLPYDIKVDIGATVYDLVSKIMDILTTWQIYCDNDGCVIVEPIPTGKNDFVYPLTPEYIISNTVTSDFRNVKNHIVVYGRTNSVDYLATSVDIHKEGDDPATLRLYFDELDLSKVSINSTTFGFESTMTNIDIISYVEFYVNEQTESNGEQQVTPKLIIKGELKSFDGGEVGIPDYELIPNELYSIKIYDTVNTLEWSEIKTFYVPTVLDDIIIFADNTGENLYSIAGGYNYGGVYVVTIFSYRDNRFVLYNNEAAYLPFIKGKDGQIRVQKILYADATHIYLSLYRVNDNTYFFADISIDGSGTTITNLGDNEAYCMVVDDNNLYGYIGCKDGIIRWELGTNMENVKNTLYKPRGNSGDNYISALTLIDDKLYCGVGARNPHGVYSFSTNNKAFEKVASWDDNIWEIALITLYANTIFVYSDAGGVFTKNLSTGELETLEGDPTVSERQTAYVGSFRFGTAIYICMNSGVLSATNRSVQIACWSLETKTAIYSETFVNCPLNEIETVSDRQASAFIMYENAVWVFGEGNEYVFASFSELQSAIFSFYGKTQVSSCIVEDNPKSPFYINANYAEQNYYCGMARTFVTGEYDLIVPDGTEIANGAIFTCMVDVTNTNGQTITVASKVGNVSTLILNRVPIKQDRWETVNGTNTRPNVIAGKISNDYTIWVFRYDNTDSENPCFVFLGKHPYAYTLICSGGEYDNIYADQLAYERCMYELYLHSNLNNSISLGYVPNYALDVNMKIPYRESWGLAMDFTDGNLLLDSNNKYLQTNTKKYLEVQPSTTSTRSTIDNDTQDEEYNYNEDKYYLIKQISYPLTISNTPQSITAIEIYESGNLFGDD